MVKLRSNKFIAPKEGETLTDCQDAIELNEDKSRYAVADGATRSFYPKMWAELLVKDFCEETTLSLKKENWNEWIESLQQKWLKQVVATVRETKRFMSIDRLSRSESAASTFVGLEIDKTKAEWKAMIIGDSCLFHIATSELKESYLIKKSEDFTNRPESFASFAKDSLCEPTFVTGQTNPGDIFILATDALAKWIIQHEEAGKLEDALEQLISIDGEHEQQFKGFIEKARETEDLRLVNDDVAFLIISIESDQHLPKLESFHQESERQQNPWLVFLACLLAGGGTLIVLYLIFYFILRYD
ncbi:MAG: hypothetical protein OXU23_21810 [Candidatus Poribacteria bacterium]|nr:hypothetical protein [Candidatus Poribacteria bacterium]